MRLIMKCPVVVVVLSSRFELKQIRTVVASKRVAAPASFKSQLMPRYATRQYQGRSYDAKMSHFGDLPQDGYWMSDMGPALDQPLTDADGSRIKRFLSKSIILQFRSGTFDHTPINCRDNIDDRCPNGQILPVYFKIQSVTGSLWLRYHRGLLMSVFAFIMGSSPLTLILCES